MNRPPEPPDGSSESLDDLLELYALDLLDDAQSDDVERLMANDPEARERLGELRGVTAMLAFDLEPVEASPELKARILRAARADLEQREAAASVVVDEPPAPEPISLEQARARRDASPGWKAIAGWAVAAVLALALAGSAFWIAHLRNQLDERPATIVFTVQGSDAAVGVNGEVMVIGDNGDTIVTLSGLPELERGKVYQIWLIAGERPDPNVTFTPDQTGLASVGVVGSATGYDQLAITVEPDGGSLAPTSPPIIFSELSSPS